MANQLASERGVVFTTGGEFTAMNPKIVIGTILLALAPWLWFASLIFMQDPEWPEDAVFLIIMLCFSSAAFWMVFTVIASIVVLPKLDRLARPDMVDMIKRSDSWWFRVMRLNGYAGALTCRRIRKAEALPVDLREQGRDLRWPLYAYIYSLQFTAFLTVAMALIMYLVPEPSVVG
ncbi:MAG: hypothetical protein LAT63_03360 [Marinobacter sp.]|nr:hypothetical protein [Marinobacter sp.]